MTSGYGMDKVRRRLPKWLIPVIGYAVSIACLVWVFHGVDFKGMLIDFVELHWVWVTLAILTDISVYIWQGWRWNLLLLPIAKIPLFRSVRAIYVGLFANEVLPLRSGEVIRCYLQAHWSEIPFSITVSSAVIERILDGIVLVLAFFLTTMFVELPKYLVDGGRILGIGTLVAALLLGLVMFWKHKAHAAVSSSRWAIWLRHLIDGLHAMGNSPSFYAAAGVSIVYLIIQVVPVYALMQAYGMDLSVWAAFVVLIVVRLGTLLPQAPGNVGSFQFFTVVGLRLFGVDKTTAVGFSLVMFGVITLPLLIVGFIALAITGLNLGDIHRHAHSRLRRPVHPHVESQPSS